MDRGEPSSNKLNQALKYHRVKCSLTTLCHRISRSRGPRSRLTCCMKGSGTKDEALLLHGAASYLIRYFFPVPWIPVMYSLISSLLIESSSVPRIYANHFQHQRAVPRSRMCADAKNRDLGTPMYLKPGNGSRW